MAETNIEMNDNPAASIARLLALETIPVSATTVAFGSWCAINACRTRSTVVASVGLPEGVLYQRNPTEIDLVGTHATRNAVPVQQRFTEDAHADYVTSRHRQRSRSRRYCRLRACLRRSVVDGVVA
ncbi:hypothetical protein O7630_28840 [Micromonospora sp. WMMD718]|uniref:hypothetical protein n=1 Tax=Micromonospora sp. WMMD718 TaxID=3016098 RepID=UPI0024180092|nr:hypothetical protein [Micromonospora sp. WMMD718]MDG4754953.1 hypothetical protein [Micromonospora sp. WMMD718]